MRQQLIANRAPDKSMQGYNRMRMHRNNTQVIIPHRNFVEVGRNVMMEVECTVEQLTTPTEARPWRYRMEGEE
jgi:hypothetical protein